MSASFCLTNLWLMFPIHIQTNPEAYLQPNQLSRMKPFTKIFPQEAQS